MPVFFDCAKCCAYCCTYPEIPVTEADIRRLARHLGLDVPSATTSLTKLSRDRKLRILRHRRDQAFQTACRFLDPGTRRCTIYEVRPAACRNYPGTPRCGYYDFLAAERRRQENPNLVLSAWVTEI